MATQVGMGVKGAVSGKRFTEGFWKERIGDEVRGAITKSPKKSSGGSKEFDAAFSTARKAGKKTFNFKGKSYHTKVKK
jgi:hypothetical protein